jgi:hypothetical protein
MSADGTSLPEFQDFVLATKPHKITPTGEILNDTAKNYYLIGDMLKGRGDEEVIQNGESIIDMVRLTTHNAAGFYKPNQNLQPRGMDVLTKLRAPWRFHQGNYAWTKEQVSLNGGGSMDNWVRLASAWRQATRQDIWDSLEAAILAVPSNSEMEADGGTRPYSLMTFLTANGLAPSGFTTVMGVNPTTQANWRNQTEGYSKAALATQLYPSFDRMWHKLNWNGPASKEEWFSSTEWRKFKILSTLEGVVQYLDLNRANNDRLTPVNDPGTFAANPTYNGIPIKRVPELETTLTAMGITAAAPYLWLDSRYIFPIFHSARYMEEGDPIAGGVNQPFSFAVYTNTYLNLFCRSRKRQGWIAGAA